MKKDIQIPEVENLDLAVVYEYNDIYKTDDWNVYLINKQAQDLELVVIVSQGFSENKTTSPDTVTCKPARDVVLSKSAPQAVIEFGKIN